VQFGVRILLLADGWVYFMYPPPVTPFITYNKYIRILG